MDEGRVKEAVEAASLLARCEAAEDKVIELGGVIERLIGQIQDRDNEIEHLEGVIEKLEQNELILSRYLTPRLIDELESIRGG